VIENNLLALLAARQSDYSIIAVAKSHKLAKEICKRLDIREDRTVPFDKSDADRIIDDVRKLYSTATREGEPKDDDDDEL
jgi:hypothetical protein